MFSVIIPYYNKANYIERCILSVLQQTFVAYEIIVIDDGSTDNGLDFLTGKYDSIVVLNQLNKGVSEARNAGIKIAKYDYLAFIDADDCWHRDYLKSVLEVLKIETNATIIGCHYTRKKDFLELNRNDLHYFKFKNYFKSALRNTYFTSSSTVICSTFFKTNSGFNSDLKSGEDIDLWLRVVLNSEGAYYIENTLVYYSDEDIHQSTNTRQLLTHTFVGTISCLYKNLIESTDNKSFKKFTSIYVYFNLYPFYFDPKQHQKAKMVLKENKEFHFLLHLVYMLPLFVGKKIVTSKNYSRLLRLYFKFVIRYIYSI